MKNMERRDRYQGKPKGNSGKGNSSWEPVGGWYNQIVGKEGHYYHQKVIIPQVLRLLGEGEAGRKVLDMGCGQGILSRALGKDVKYTGVDLSDSLIKEAKKLNRLSGHEFILADTTKTLPLKDHDYTHAIFILSLQNMALPAKAIAHAAKHLVVGGKLVLVLNHPCFRIPRQSSWGVDEKQKVQYRRVDKYLSPLEVPIQAAPSKGVASSETWSYHHPLSSMMDWLREARFVVEGIEEWCSDKESTGGAAKMENRSRQEIPMFMMIEAVKRG